VLRPSIVAKALAVMTCVVTPGAAAAQTETVYGSVDESDVRFVVERVASSGLIEYRLSIIPKGGLRLNGAVGIKVAAVSAPGWLFQPPLPRTVYAGNDYFDGAPEITIAAAPRRDAGEAILVIMYALCREAACFGRDTSLAITQR